MFQALQIEARSKQEGLTHLRARAESFRFTEENGLSISARRR